MSNSNQLKLGAIVSYGVILFNIVAGLLYTPWMINQIGKADYGLYILMTSFLSYFVVDYGVWMSVNKLLSQYRAEGNSEKVKQTIGVATKIYLAIDIVIAIVLAIVYLNIDSIFSNLSAEELYKFKRIFLIAGGAAVLNFPFVFVRGIMYSHEYLIQSKLFELGAKVFLILSTVVALSFNGGIYWLVAVYASAPLIKSIIIVGFLYRKGVRMKLMFWDRAIVSSIFAISSWLILIVIAEMFINNISPAIITIRSSIEEVAVFAIGLTMYGYVYTISNAVTGLFLPAVERMKHNNDKERIDSYTTKIGRIQLLISGYLIFAIFTTGSTFIEMWVGESFANSYIVASLLIIPCLAMYAQQIENTRLVADNKLKYKSAMMFCTAACSVALSYLLTPRYGAVGAAIAICISNVAFRNIGMNIIYCTKMGYNIELFLKFFLKFVATFAVVMVVSRIIYDCIVISLLQDCNLWLEFFILAGVYSVLFAVISWTLLMNRSEKEEVQKLLKLKL